VGRGSEEPTIFAKWLIFDLPNRLLHYETRRAVVYRGPRLGALIGLAHRISRSPLLTFGEMPGLSGASPHLCNLRILKLCGSETNPRNLRSKVQSQSIIGQFAPFRQGLAGFGMTDIVAEMREKSAFRF
jgi:hypothetical protein